MRLLLNVYSILCILYRGQINLSVLGELIPKSQRPANYHSLIQPVRNIADLDLHHLDNVWTDEEAARICRNGLEVDLEGLWWSQSL